MIDLWLAFITAWLEACRINTAPDGFRPPRFDPASDVAQGGRGIRENHIARFSEATGSLNKYHGEK